MLVGLLMFSLVGTFVFADDETSLEDGLTISAEPIPADSSTGVFWNKFQRALAFNSEKKAELSLKIAEKQMLRAGECSEDGDYDCAQNMIQNHEENMLRAEAYLDDVEANGDENATRLAIARTIAMQNRIEAQEERALEIKAGILERQADRMTEEQLAHLEEVFAGVETRSEEALQKVEQRQENLKAKYKVMTGMTDEEIEESIVDYEGYLAQQREMRQARITMQDAKVQQYKGSIKAKPISGDQDQIRAQDGTGEFHDENLEEGGMNGSGIKGNQ